MDRALVSHALNDIVMKANPSVSDVHVNAPLTNLSVAYMQDEARFVAGRVFPDVPVSKQSDLYYVYDRGDFNRDLAKVRAPSTESAGGGYRVSTTPYYAPVYAFHRDIDDQIRANADPQFNLDAEATRYISQVMMIRKEIIFTTNYFTTGLWTTEYAGAAGASSTEKVYWSDDNSDPVVDIEDAKNVMLELTGFEPNTLVLGKKVWSALKNNVEVKDRIKYGQTASQPARATLDTIRNLFEIETIYVASAIQNTAEETTAGGSETNSFIAGNHALLCYVAPRPGMMTPSAGYTFSWTGYLGAGAMGNRISRMRFDKIHSDRIEIESAFAMQLVAADLGVFFKDIILTAGAGT